MPMMSRNSLIVALAAGMLLAACGDSPSGDEQQSSTAPKKPLPAASVLPPEMVAAVSAARNTSVISVHFALGNPPTVNKALPVDIAIVPHQPVTLVRAHFESRDGLGLATGNVLDTKTDPALEKPIKHQLVLLPSRDGVFMVTAVVETEGLEGTVTRVFSIPVIVAPPAEAAAPTAPAAPAVPAGSSG